MSWVFEVILAEPVWSGRPSEAEEATSTKKCYFSTLSSSYTGNETQPTLLGNTGTYIYTMNYIHTVKYIIYSTYCEIHKYILHLNPFQL